MTAKTHWKNCVWIDPAVTALFVDLWGSKTSVASIAARLGVSEAACRHKADRMGLKRPPYIQAKKPKPEKKVIKPKLTLVKREVVTFTPPEIKGVSLLDRTGCCFPVNDGGPFLFCDAPGKPRSRDGSDYCDYHWHVMTDRSAQYHPQSFKSAHRATEAT